MIQLCITQPDHHRFKTSWVFFLPSTPFEQLFVPLTFRSHCTSSVFKVFFFSFVVDKESTKMFVILQRLPKTYP